MNEFEQKILRQPLKKIPGDWRAEILANAESAAVRRTMFASQPSLFSTFNRQLSTFFWPHPKAWAGLAAIWIFIFAVNFSMRDKSPQVVEKIAPPSPEMLVELKQQQRLFAELIGANDLREADRQKLFLPRPRSEREKVLVA
ncbi:MAG TPA: hypothetical protein VK840_03510 [Candidatus Dormibacteraeota bacterium]|jgi:hypothetical protein|nr:hypothetical protein [Candidatus Dormibacteraeota bacterium]